MTEIEQLFNALGVTNQNEAMAEIGRLHAANIKLGDMATAALLVRGYLESTLPEGSANEIMRPFDGLLPTN